MTASSTGLLPPHPPHLYPVAERQAFSGSYASSSSASSTSTDFGRLSRNSSSSAYLTDLTPPISPSQSKCDLKLMDGDAGGCLPRSGPLQEPSDVNTPVCSEMGLTMDKGYSADSEPDETAFDTFAAIKSKLGRASQSINTRRALQIMERRAKPTAGRAEGRPRMSSLSSKVVVTEMESGAAEDWSRELSSTCTVETSGLIADDVDVLGSLHAPEGAVSLSSGSAFAGQDCAQEDGEFARDFTTPPKPVLRPTELDVECSPLSLYSQDLSSSMSLLLMSPPNLDVNDSCPSPAIWNASFADRNPPHSPFRAISASAFSRNSRQTPTSLTGEDLDIASLIRLETAATMGMQSTPNLRASSRRVQSLPSPGSPYYEESWEEKDDPSFVRWQAAAIFAHPSHTDLPVNHELSGLPVDIQRQNGQAEQPVVGLGLGGLAESSLCSSSSISRLRSAPDGGNDKPSSEKIEDECVDREKPLPVKPDEKIEPKGVLARLRASGASPVKCPSLSPIQNLPRRQKRLRHPLQHNEQKANAFNPSVIEHPTLQAKPSTLDSVSPPRTMRRRDFVKSRASVRPRQAGDKTDQGATLADDAGDILDKYAEISLEFRHLPLQPPDPTQDECAKPREIEQGTALHEKDSLEPPPSKPPSRLLHNSDHVVPNHTSVIRLSGLPTLEGDDPCTKSKLEVKIGNCGIPHRSFPLPDFQPYIDPPADSSDSLRQKPRPSWVRDDYIPSGSAPFVLSPDNDPRSPCTPSGDYFQRSSYISGRRSALSTSSALSRGGLAGSSSRSHLSSNAQATALSNRPSDPSVRSNLAGISAPEDSRQSGAVDVVGIGLPPDLASRPPRQRESSSSSAVGLAEGLQFGILPSTASCLNLAQLATGPSPDPQSSSAAIDLLAELLEDSPTSSSKFTRFAKRCLSAIPEQNTPSPNAPSCRLRVATPYSPTSNSPWSDFSVLNRFRSPRSPSSTPAASSGQDTKRSATKVCQAKRTGCEGQNLFKRYFCSPKEEGQSAQSNPTMAVPQTPPSATSPGVIECPSAPKGLKIFKRHRHTPLESAGPGRPKSPFRSFRVLF